MSETNVNFPEKGLLAAVPTNDGITIFPKMLGMARYFSPGEVSGNENRALYTGFAGAGNILPAIFPLAGGAIVSRFGYQAFFILFLLIIAMAGFFIYKINCKK
jgi:MFS family permease